MTARTTRGEIIAYLLIEIRTAAARLELATDSYMVDRHREELRIKCAAVVELGGESPIIEGAGK